MVLLTGRNAWNMVQYPAHVTESILLKTLMLVKREAKMQVRKYSNTRKTSAVPCALCGKS